MKNLEADEELTSQKSEAQNQAQSANNLDESSHDKDAMTSGVPKDELLLPGKKRGKYREETIRCKGNMTNDIFKK